MIENKPSIYNAQSVYNHGGGGDGSFEVDIGGGVPQTLVFPPYLQPVEYISLENYTANNFCLFGCSQIPFRNDYKFRFVLSADPSKMGNDYNAVFSLLSPFNPNNNQEIMITAREAGSILPNYGQASHNFTSLDLTKKIIVDVNASNGVFKISYSDGGSFTYTDTRVKGSENYGQWNFFNIYGTASAQTFHGKFFYSYLKRPDDTLAALWIPAKAKDANDTKPFIVDCVAGSVGVNCSRNSTTTGIEYGPDIDLSEEIPNWIT